MADPPPDTAANVRELRAKIVALRALISEGSLDEALPAASRVPALKLTTDALAILGRFLEGAHSIQDAAGALACRLTGRDEAGHPVPHASTGLAHVSKTTASLEVFAGAIVDAAVERATLAAPRVTACSRCDHLMGDRIKLLGEIEDLNMKLEAVRARAQTAPAADPRWAAALERVAQRYASDGRSVVAASVRSAIALGVDSEHAAQLVLAALGWSNPNAVERALSDEVEEGDSNDVR